MGAFAGVSAGECVPNLGHFKGLGPLGGLYCSRFFLIVLKCLFKYPIVVMLTLLTLKTLLQVNVKPL